MKKICTKTFVLVLILAFAIQSCTQNSKQGTTQESQSDSSNAVSTDTIASTADTNPENIQLTDKKVKFLWREKKYNQEVKADVSSLVLNEDYIKNISDPERAVLGLIATFVGNECAWDGEAKADRSNLKCKILWALDLGYQCSTKQMDFLRQWFRAEPKILEELKNCPTTPDGATIQDTFDEINLEVKGNQILVSFKANGINLRDATSWNWTEDHTYELKGDELFLINKKVSEKKQSKISVGEN
ncbi:hypothetical protein [Sphingobacterium mizutaii]|uniref:hypothetical protein n=1 Tax=Sphingobacterium mizutaii TaxID=1010 RepID=UPI003D99631E